ncbi:hypothetical protein K5X82_10820 [Halosquirtibacter xylanolyticus]|uniref:hypothetical protein n=1 Tax=Halosquirtibacter xylanolyticus TaxID=3374599 RepID=UPI003749BA3B|nr:hypothetical protein K5X82_10820 [Prolixibacteraceae bacterium]
MKNETKKLAIAFLLGICTMYTLDYLFHFNNPISKVEKEINKASKDLKSLFK